MFGISEKKSHWTTTVLSWGIIFIMVSCSTKVENNEVKTYFDNGKLKRLERYEGSGETRVKIYEEQYYDNGILRVKGAFKKGKRHGDWKVWYASGRLWSEGSYVEGIRQGYSRAYYESGIIRMEGDYIDDKQVGLWLFWDENGQLAHKENFK